MIPYMFKDRRELLIRAARAAARLLGRDVYVIDVGHRGARASWRRIKKKGRTV